MTTPSRKVYGYPVRKILGETFALASTLIFKLFQPDFHEVIMYCASAYRLGIVPKIGKVIYYDASTGLYHDYTKVASNRVDADNVPLGAMQTDDILYLYLTDKARGFYFNPVTGLNTNAADLDMEYMSAIAAGVPTFTDVAGDNDGTKTSTETLSQPGLYKFTLPAVVTGRITAIEKQIAAVARELLKKPYYIYRFKPTAALPAPVSIVDIIAAMDTTAYGYRQAGMTYGFAFNNEEAGGFEFDVVSGTPDMYIDWGQH